MLVTQSPFLRKACPTTPRAVLVLVLLCLALFLPGWFTLPPTDRDEARFAQASKQMVESGDYIDIRFQDETRYKKPIGIYWLQTAGVNALHAVGLARLNDIWAYRLPSLLGATGAVLLFFGLFQRLMGREQAFVAAVILACCLILTVEARLAKTDAVLLLSFMLMFGGLARAYLRHCEGGVVLWPTWLLFWGGMTLSVLLKGPVGPAVAVLALFSLRWMWGARGLLGALRPMSGLLLVLLVALPWFITIQLKSDGAFVQESLKGDFFSKLLEGQESHGKPPGFYLLLAPLLLWPFAPLVFRALPYWRQLVAQPLARFALAWVFPGWLLFELVPTKLPHYVLPFLPGLILLAVLALPLPSLRPVWWLQGVRGLLIVIWAIVCIALMGAGVLLPYQVNGAFSPWSVLVVIGAGVVLVTGLQALLRRDAGRFLWAAPLGAVLVYAGVLQGILPGLQGVWLSPALQRVVEREGNPPFTSGGYREPSLAFLTGTKTLMTTPEGAVLFLSGHPNGLAAIDSAGDAAFRQAAAAIGLAVQETERVRGFNYSRGDWVEMVVYRVVR